MKLRKLIRWMGWLLLAVVLAGLAGLGSLWWMLHASLAQLDGRRTLAGLAAPVRVERDRLGVPNIQAASRLDAARALGFLHAQERFFQMDLSRRAGGGELSELFGKAVLEQDRAQRIHRPRAHAKLALAQARPEEAALLKAYAEGVNAGLAALAVRPPEYLALRARPRPWQPEDSCLVGYAMFDLLHDVDGQRDYREAVLRRALSPAARAFFNGPDSIWGAALDGSTNAPARLPTADEFDARLANRQARLALPSNTATAAVDASPETLSDLESEGIIGSNNWAVDGRRSGTGAAIVANDMHLGLGVPNTWYRARLIYRDPVLGEQQVVGVTLPGTPVVVSGSNRYVAWGNTASEMDIADLVVLEFDPANPRRYRAGSGWRELENHPEVIHVRGGTNVTVMVEETLWGPVVRKGGARYALACTIHLPQAIDMGLVRVEQARTVTEALDAAATAGTPVNNFIVGDRAGHIGYSLLGRLPRRLGFDGVTPCAWEEGTRGWDGWLPAQAYPRLMDPEDGILWSANNRTLGSREYQALHGAPDNGARARQIRDDLRAARAPTEAALWNIYRDDRALFLERWQKSLLSALEAGTSTNAEWRTARDLVARWGARAAVDSPGYRLVRGFRSQTLELLFEPVNRYLARFDGGTRIYNEDAAWALLEARPVHLLNPDYASYDALLQASVNRILGDLQSHGIALTNATWGARNHLGIRHPLSRAVPRLSRWLDMPDASVSGDAHMPKVHVPGFGVSERLIVSPGHEENGLFNMPCGQSGHFLSPYYRSEMNAWLQVQPQPLLPGPRQHVMELVPGRPS